MDRRRSGCMDILPIPESFQHGLIPGHMGCHPEFDLGIIHSHQGHPGAATKALLTCLPSSVRTGYILQIWIC